MKLYRITMEEFKIKETIFYDSFIKSYNAMINADRFNFVIFETKNESEAYIKFNELKLKYKDNINLVDGYISIYEFNLESYDTDEDADLDFPIILDFIDTLPSYLTFCNYFDTIDYIDELQYEVEFTIDKSLIIDEINYIDINSFEDIKKQINKFIKSNND